MRHVSVLLAALVLLGAPACGGGGDEPRPEPSSARPTPDDGGLAGMEPGTYRSAVFRPAITFRTEARFWQKEYETEERLSLWGLAADDDDYDEGSMIDVLRPYALYDPTRPRVGRPWPRDMAAFLRDHTDLRASAPRRAQVSGLPAQVVDLRPRKEVDLWVDSLEQQHFMDETTLVRVYVIDAGEEQRLIVLTILREKGAAGFEPLDRIVRTLRFAS